MFPIQEKIKEQEESDPFYVDYVISAKGWRASGGIKCSHPEDKHFWGMLQMAVKSIINGNNMGILNESYTDGFSRYIRPVKQNEFTLRWEEIDYLSSEQSKMGEPQNE